MNGGDFDAIRKDMSFYLENTFQFSFVYVGAVYGALAGADGRVVGEMAKSLHTQPVAIVFTAILVLNLVYLVLASSCAFAILKRAFFILIYNFDRQDGTNVLAGWESFTRRRQERFGRISWNIDNYFSVLVYLMVFTISGTLYWHCVREFDSPLRWIVVMLALMHIVPVVALMKALKLSTLCSSHGGGNSIPRANAQN